MGKVWTLRFNELNLYLKKKKKIDFCREKIRRKDWKKEEENLRIILEEL